MRLKKVKNAIERIHVSEYYVNSPESYQGKWKQVFSNEKPIYLEIGMGKGNFIIEMAQKHPEANFIGVEMYDSVLVKAVEKLESMDKIPNLKLLLYDANHIDSVFEKEINRIYLNFSDPWPKKRHAKRRLTSESFLKKYDSIFAKQKEIFLKTDNVDFFEYSLESLKAYGYEIKTVSRDWHHESTEENVMTEYETKFVSQGVPINRLEAYQQ